MKVFDRFRRDRAEKRRDWAEELRSLLKEGHGFLMAEEYEKARTVFVQILEYRDYFKNTPVLEYVISALHCTWLFTERYDEGIMFFSEYINRYPADINAYCARAGEFWYVENLQKAIDDYSRVLEINPENITALSERGQVFAEAGNFPEALKDLDRALQIISESSSSELSGPWSAQIKPFIHRARGVALAGLGDNTG